MERISVGLVVGVEEVMPKWNHGMEHNNFWREIRRAISGDRAINPEPLYPPDTERYGEDQSIHRPGIAFDHRIQRPRQVPWQRLKRQTWGGG